MPLATSHFFQRSSSSRGWPAGSGRDPSSAENFIGSSDDRCVFRAERIMIHQDGHPHLRTSAARKPVSAFRRISSLAGCLIGPNLPPFVSDLLGSTVIGRRSSDFGRYPLR